MSETIEQTVVEVALCLRSWYGHPEERAAEDRYNAEREGDRVNWLSGLRCWNLINANGNKIGRAYEPTATTPVWVWRDERGDQPIPPPVSHEQLVVLMVEYRLKGGLDADPQQ